MTISSSWKHQENEQLPLLPRANISFHCWVGTINIDISQEQFLNETPEVLPKPVNNTLNVYVCTIICKCIYVFVDISQCILLYYLKRGTTHVLPRNGGVRTPPVPSAISAHDCCNKLGNSVKQPDSSTPLED